MIKKLACSGNCITHKQPRTLWLIFRITSTILSLFNRMQKVTLRGAQVNCSIVIIASLQLFNVTRETSKKRTFLRMRASAWQKPWEPIPTHHQLPQPLNTHVVWSISPGVYLAIESNRGVSVSTKKRSRPPLEILSKH